MSRAPKSVVVLGHPDCLYINGSWVRPASRSWIDVLDSNDEQPFLRVAEAGIADVARAVDAARHAFDEGPWPRLTHAERADHLRSLGAELSRRSTELAEIWSRESGMMNGPAQLSGRSAETILSSYADIASDYPWTERHTPTNGESFGMLVREPVGVVGAIIPWNGPLSLALYKLAPALLSGCTTILKASPEAPGAAYLIAEACDAIGLPPGVVNVVTADRATSEALVRDPRVDKISFTGSTAVGRHIGAILGGRIGRFSAELGGKSAAIILDDADIETSARTIATSACTLSGQVCAALTRAVVSRHRYDEFVAALGAAYGAKRVGSAFDPDVDLGPLVSAAQRERVERYIALGRDEGAVVVTGGGRPRELERGYFVEPTVLAGVDNRAVVAQEEIFGPVLVVVPAADEQDAVRLANDSVYGLNASIFTPDIDRALVVARRIRSGTVGHNGSRVDYGIAFGGFGQSGLGREGGREGLLPYLETKTVILRGEPSLEY